MKIRIDRVLLEEDEKEDRTQLLTGCACTKERDR